MISMHTFVVCKSILVNRVWQCDRKETAVQMVYFIVLHCTYQNKNVEECRIAAFFHTDT